MEQFLTWWSDLISQTMQLQIDPLAAGISIVALAVAVSSLRLSKRSANLAEQLANERGKLKKVHLRLPDWETHLNQGKPVGHASDLPARDMSTGALEVVGFSGDHELTVSSVRLVVLYTVGLIQPRVHYVHISIDGTRTPGLNVTGPSLPHTIRPYDSATWRLPKIFVMPKMAKTSFVPHAPGLVMLDPWRAIAVAAHVQSTAYQADGTASLVFGSSWVLKRARSTFARHFPYQSLGELMESKDAPKELKHLLQFWHVGVQSPGASSSGTNSGPTTSQTKKRRRPRRK